MNKTKDTNTNLKKQIIKRKSEDTLNIFVKTEKGYLLHDEKLSLEMVNVSQQSDKQPIINIPQSNNSKNNIERKSVITNLEGEFISTSKQIEKHCGAIKAFFSRKIYVKKFF